MNLSYVGFGILSLLIGFIIATVLDILYSRQTEGSIVFLISWFTAIFFIVLSFQ